MLLPPPTTHSATRSAKSSVLRSFVPPSASAPLEILRAWPCPPPFTRRVSDRPDSPAQKRGLAFERKVLRSLGECSGLRPSPWYCYHSVGSGQRYCQPDALLLDTAGNKALIIEIKLRFVARAWHQLRNLYQPIIERAHLGLRTSVLCIAQRFEPDTAIPEEITFISELSEVQEEKFNVLIWKNTLRSPLPLRE